MVKYHVYGRTVDLPIPPSVFPSDEEIKQMDALLEEHQHGWFRSSIEGAALHYRIFLPKSQKPKGVIIFVNGINDHSGGSYRLSDGRRTNVALLKQIYNRADMALYSFDPYAHGFSEGNPRFSVPSWEKGLQDYLNFVKIVADIHPDLTLFLSGMSYGGALTILASRKIQDNPSLGPKRFGGIILFSPAIIADKPPAPVYYLLRYVLAPTFPSWTPPFMPNPVPAERIWKNREILAPNQHVRNKEMMIQGCCDPLCLGTASNLVQALDEVITKAIPGFRVPFFVCHGTKDEGVKIEGSEYLWSTADTPETDRQFIRVQGGYHDLLSEEGCEHLLQKSVEWMQAKL